jgi:hypothetical protein
MLAHRKHLLPKDNAAPLHRDADHVAGLPPESGMVPVKGPDMPPSTGHGADKSE